jgi:glycosyltransferase involved in cell wall biosynthesis
MISDAEQPNARGKRPLSVLVISNHYSLKKQYPFAGVFVDRQVDSLRKAGVTISTFDIETIRTPFAFVRCWIELRRTVRKLEFDLIHAQYGSVVGLLAVLLGRPTVISFCGHDLLPGAGISALRMFMGFMLSNLSAFVATALVCKSEELRRALWWGRDRAVVIPNGVDLELFCPGSQFLARKNLNWNHDRPVVLFVVGSNPKRKGQDLAEAAMEIVRQRVPCAEICMLCDVQPDMMPQYYRAADVLLCASKREGSPNVVKEALACNLPVVSVPVGDVAERLKDVSPSAIVSRDPHAIAEALTSVLITRNRSNGRERVESLSLDRIGRRVCEVYHLVGQDISRAVY